MNGKPAFVTLITIQSGKISIYFAVTFGPAAYFCIISALQLLIKQHSASARQFIHINLNIRPKPICECRNAVRSCMLVDLL
jgi:hypothetical protein